MDLHEKFLQDAEDYWFHLYRPQPGDVVVDIGAGQGEDVFAFAPAVGEQGRVFAVEADPGSFETLKQFCALHRLQNVTVLNVACCDRSCELRVQRADNWVSTSVRADLSDGTGPVIEGVRFDDIRTRHGITMVDFLKMNIEGAERVALPGCSKTLESTRFVCIAAHDFRADRGDGEEFRTQDFVSAFLRDADFEIVTRLDDERPYVRGHIHGRNRRFQG